MALAENQQLERPDGPKWHDGGKSIVLANHALPAPEYWAATHSPKSGNADEDCWPPSASRDSRKSARAAPNRFPRDCEIRQPRRQSPREFLPATCVES